MFLFCVYFSSDSDEKVFFVVVFFHWKKAIFWIVESYFTWKQKFEVKNPLMMDLFLTNTQLFTSQDVNFSL